MVMREVQTGMVLQQCPIALEHNEVSTLKPLLTEVQRVRLNNGSFFTKLKQLKKG